MIDVKRKENETVGALLRRFTRRVQQSGVLIGARKLKSYKSKPTKRIVRERALRRLEKDRERVRLEKLGKSTADSR
jgi:ribosomal protein S21